MAVTYSLMSDAEESSRKTTPSFYSGKLFKGCNMCILKESCIEISSWIIFYLLRKVMLKFVILEWASWCRIKIIPRLSNAERRLIFCRVGDLIFEYWLHQRYSEVKGTKGSRVTFGVQVWFFTPCSTELCHSKRPTWSSYNSRSSTSSAPGALLET